MTIFEMISRNQYKRKQQQNRSILKQNELFHNKNRIMPFFIIIIRYFSYWSRYS